MKTVFIYALKCPPEVVEKMRIAASNPSEETREKMRQARLGQKLSPETKAKISLGISGEKNPNFGKSIRRPHTAESKAKISVANKGRKFSAVGLQNIREGQQRRRAREKGEI